jgi:hypothetical protein
MSVFPSSAIGLPQSVNYSLPPSLSENARSYSVNISPDGITSVAGPANLPGGTLAAAASVTPGAYTAQVVSFTIPSGMSKSTFLDCANTNLSFTLTYTVATASNISVVPPIFALVGSAASWFDSMVLYSNNVPIETINSYGLLNNYLLNNTVSPSERYGGTSVSMGTDTNTANGIDLIMNTTGTYRYNFCIPLLSVIGVNSDKWFPVGSVNNLQLQMTTASITPIVFNVPAGATVTTQPAFTGGFNLSEFSLNMKYIDLGDVAGNLLQQTLQDGKWFMKSTTYTNSNVTIPSGSSGAQQLLLQIRNTSVKSILHQFGQNFTSGVTPNGYYDAVNPALIGRQLQIGGDFFPNQVINDCARPAFGYTYLLQAMGSNLGKAQGTVVNRYSYNTVVPSIPVGSDSTMCTVATGLRSTAGSNNLEVNVVQFPSMAYYGYDLEKSAGVLLQGYNTRASPGFLNLNLGVASTSTLLCSSWGMSDVILQIDSVSKQITAFI